MIAAVVEDGDLVGQRVRLVQVLRGQQDGGALARPGRARSSRPRPAWSGPARWSARPGRSPTAGRPGSRPGRAAAACRRSRSWPAGRRRRSGRTRPAARRPRRFASPRRRSSSRPISTRFSVPVRSSSTEAYCPVSPISRRTRSASATTSSPPTRALPPSGRSSVASTRTAVVLPAPFGPSTPSTVPGRPRGPPRPARSSCRTASPGPRPRSRTWGSPLSSGTRFGRGAVTVRTDRCQPLSAAGSAGSGAFRAASGSDVVMGDRRAADRRAADRLRRARRALPARAAGALLPDARLASHEAEDLVQETYLRAWRALRRFERRVVAADLALPDRHQRLPDRARAARPAAAAVRARRARRRPAGAAGPRRRGAVAAAVPGRAGSADPAAVSPARQACGWRWSRRCSTCPPGSARR